MTRNRAEVSEAHVSGGDDYEGPLDGDDNGGRATGSGAAEAMPRPRCAGAAVQRYTRYMYNDDPEVCTPMSVCAPGSSPGGTQRTTNVNSFTQAARISAYVARPAQPVMCEPSPSSLPATLRGQLESTDATRGPRRPKSLVVVTQGHRDHPAARSRLRTPSYKFTSTKLCTLSPPTSGAPCEPGEATTWTLSVAHRLGATRRPSGACSARTSPMSGSFDQFVKLAAHA